MAAATAILSNPLFLTRNPQGLHLSLALSSVSSSINPLDKRALSGGPGKLRITNSITRSPLTVQAAAYSDGGRRPKQCKHFCWWLCFGRTYSWCSWMCICSPDQQGINWH
ncbi:hypothetical protein OIU76_001206 [Salix suchowensis]|nr:hypothetical protein OIU76_001206 [Salix suchowensis]